MPHKTENVARVQTPLEVRGGDYKRFLRSDKTDDDDDDQKLSEANEERTTLEAYAKLQKMMDKIDAGKVKEKYFQYFDATNSSPAAVYKGWGFAKNGVDRTNPRYMFWEKYRDWYYQKYPFLIS